MKHKLTATLALLLSCTVALCGCAENGSSQDSAEQSDTTTTASTTTTTSKPDIGHEQFFDGTFDVHTMQLPEEITGGAAEEITHFNYEELAAGEHNSIHIVAVDAEYAYFKHHILTEDKQTEHRWFRYALADGTVTPFEGSLTTGDGYSTSGDIAYVKGGVYQNYEWGGEHLHTVLDTEACAFKILHTKPYAFDDISVVSPHTFDETRYIETWYDIYGAKYTGHVKLLDADGNGKEIIEKQYSKHDSYYKYTAGNGKVYEYALLNEKTMPYLTIYDENGLQTASFYLKNLVDANVFSTSNGKIPRIFNCYGDLLVLRMDSAENRNTYVYNLKTNTLNIVPSDCEVIPTCDNAPEVCAFTYGGSSSAVQSLYVVTSDDEIVKVAELPGTKISCISNGEAILALCDEKLYRVTLP